MLLRELTRKFFHQLFAVGCADWLRISLAGLVSVALVFLIAQWTALLGVVLTLNRAHLTETHRGHHPPPEPNGNRRRLELSRAPPMHGTTGRSFQNAPVSDDLSGWEPWRPLPPRPIPPPPIKTPQPLAGAPAPSLPPMPQMRPRLAASGLSLSDFNIVAESTRLIWRANPLSPGLLTASCTCGTASRWRWSTSERIGAASSGRDPPLSIVEKPRGVP